MRKIIAIFLAMFLLVPVNICVIAYEGSDNFVSESETCVYNKTFCSITTVDGTSVLGDKFVVDNIVYQVIECDKINKVFKVQVGTGEKGSGDASKSKSLTIDLNIPDTVLYKGDEYNVVSISKGAFYCTEFLFIYIGDNVETIGEEAFKNCLYTSTLDFGEKVKNIEDNAFEGCFRIKSLYMGCRIEKIGNNAFKGCQLLNEVNINGKLSQLGECAFAGCENLKGVRLVLADGTIEREAFQNCNKLENIVFEGQLVTIKECAFKNCYMLSEINFDNGLRFIGDYAFANCYSLKKAKMPLSLTEIGEGAFSCCNSLENIFLNNGIKSIGNNAFEYCVNLIGIIIPYSVDYIGEGAFKGCESLVVIEVDTDNLNYSSELGVLFNKDQTKLIKLPEGILLNEYIIPDTVRIIGKESCINCRLESIKFNSMARIIEESAFCGSDIKKVSFGEGLEIIERRAFANSPYLGIVVIPKSVKYIGDEAFFSCFGAADIWVEEKKDESDFIDGVGKRWHGGSVVKYEDELIKNTE